MTLPSSDTKVSTRSDRPARGSAATLAETQAFLESSIVSRPNLDRAAELADRCDAIGEVVAGNALRRLVAKACDSNPEALEAAAEALNIVEGIRCSLRRQPAIPAGAPVLGRVVIVDQGGEDGRGEITARAGSEGLTRVAQLLSRLADLTTRARKDPASFVAWARTVLSTASRDKRAEIVWALASASSADAARLILATPGLGRCTTDALVRIPEVEEDLTDFVKLSLKSTALLETEADAILAAASALIRLGHSQVAFDLAESSYSWLSAIGSCIISPDLNSTDTLSRGLSAILEFGASGDSEALADRITDTAPNELLRIGRFVAGWPAGERAAASTLDRWLNEECHSAYAALIAGVEPPCAASLLIDRGRQQDRVLASLLTGLASRVAILNYGNLLSAGEVEDAPLDPAMAYFSATPHSRTTSSRGHGAIPPGGTGIHDLAELAANGSLTAMKAIAASQDPVARRYEELLLTSVFSQVAIAAAEAVAARGSTGVQYASHLIESGDPSLLEAAFNILARSSLEDARDDLLDALDSNDPWLLRAAAFAAAEAAAATEDREISRALIKAITRIAGGSLTVVPAVAAIGNNRAINQIVRLNERGQLFDCKRDDQLLAELLAVGEQKRQAAISRAERERELLYDSWRAQGRLDDFGGGKLSRLAGWMKNRGGRPK